MSLITITKEQDLFEFFKSISPADVRECAEPRVYRKGKEYHEMDHVCCAFDNHDISIIEATVKGTIDYKVTISKSEVRIYGTCSCGKMEICKHVVSVLLYGIHDRNFIHHCENEMQKIVN